MTETVTTFVNFNRVAGKVGSLGKPCSGVTVKIVAGELWVKTPALMQGYWEQPQLTAETVVDGWMRTGDLVEIDEDGYYWFKGRKKHLVVFNGSNIYPQEVENVLLKFSGIKKAAVVAKSDRINGEIPIAFIVLEEDMIWDENKLLQFLNEQIAAYKIPREFYCLEEMPITSMGKVDRAALKRRIK